MNDPVMRHASRREIADLIDGVLSGARLARVEAHLHGGCASCDAAVERAQALMATIAAGPLPSPPSSARRRASALFGAAWRRAAVGRVREVLASLVLDQRLAPTAALRGTPGTGRRLLWHFDGVEIVVSVAARGARSDLLGQILPASDDPVSAGEVELLRDGSAFRSETYDGEGDFALREIPAGTYVLRGLVEGTTFRTPPFVVG